MRIGNEIVGFLKNAVECVDSVCAEMRNVGNRNAYTLLEPANYDGVGLAVQTYECMLSHRAVPIKGYETEIAEQVEELEEAWAELFDAAGQRLKSHHGLSDVRTRHKAVITHLAAFFKRKKGTAPDPSAASAVSDFKDVLSALSEEVRDAPVAETKKDRKPKKQTAKRVPGTLTQERVASDFCVTRQTVSTWEKNQTVDGPENKSNHYGYYRSLRLNTDLRGAYDELVMQVKRYLKTKAAAEQNGERFQYTFVQFNESLAEHNQRPDI